MKSAMDSIKDLEVQVKQWQGRLDSARVESERLKRTVEQLKEEDKNIRATLEQDAQAKLTEVRKETAKMHEERALFEAQKNEFLAMMNAFKKEKNAFEWERQSALDMKKNSEAITEKVGQFVRLVKSAAEGL